MKKIAIILSGCGNRDGSELQESLSLMLAIDRRGWQYQCFAPEGIFEVVPHVDVEDPDDAEEGSLVDTEQRDIFVESARIARGDIKPIDQYSPGDYDCLALPGGMGAARNLSTFAFDGPRVCRHRTPRHHNPRVYGRHANKRDIRRSREFGVSTQ